MKVSGQTLGYSRKQLTLIWAFSFAIWTLVALLWEFAMSKWRQSIELPTPKDERALVLINQWIFAALTPLIFLAALWRPFDKRSWGRRIPAYVLGGLLFAAVHVAIRVLVYPVRDPRTGVGFGLFQPAGLCFCGFKNIFLYDLVDDLYQVYLPVVVIAHAVTYDRKSKADAIRASELEKQLARAQLQALKMQLHPHFLFNTMKSISALMHIDVSAADRMITRLCDFLRQTLEKSGLQDTTLRDELDFIATYLSIEQIRLQERLSTKFAIDPETLDAVIPHVLLQPLAENAIRHALSKRVSGGIFRITSAVNEGRLRLLVGDNGPGCAAPRLDDSGPGLGLKITRERLHAFYGADFLFEVHADPGAGVEVVIEIPFRAKDEDREQVAQQLSAS